MMNEKLHATIMMVTHDSFAASFASRILFIKDGTVFNEIRRGDTSRADFFNRIMEAVSYTHLPRTGRRPWAAVQLRAEDPAGQSYNLVGFQTNLTFPEQRRVFRMIPGLEQAEFCLLYTSGHAQGRSGGG